MEKSINGIITRIESKDHYVLTEDGDQTRCYLRGKFQKEFELKKDKLYALDITAVGDRVKFNLNDDGSGVIHSIEKRKNYLSRKAPKVKGASFRGERLEQIIAANVDNLFIVTSIKKPKFNPNSVDRIIVAGESSHLNIYIIINKTDLDKKGEAEKWKEFYESVGYKVFLTSIENSQVPQQELAKITSDNTSIFWGHSGVGKSSFLNYLYPQLNLKVKKVSDYSNKGRHTTVTVRMEEIDSNTFIIDTPGIREIEPYGITKENLSHYFIEFKPFIHDCKFNTCTHHHEPGCAVRKGVKENKISTERYSSYLNILETIEDDMIF